MHAYFHRLLQKPNHRALWPALIITLSVLHLVSAAIASPVLASPPWTISQNLDVLTVNATEDPGNGQCDVDSCTLRDAILAANANPGLDTIQFAIPGAGPHTIALHSPLPAITQPVRIDGTTQPDFGGVPHIELEGSQAGNAQGLRFTSGADNSVVEGLAINGFARAGIRLEFVDGVTVRNNYIGIGADGETPRGNGEDGVVIVAGSFNNILANTIGANTGNGLFVMGSDAQNNVISRNFIGTNHAGADLGNSVDGILALNSGPQIIGGTYLDSGCCEGNTIAFNQENGVAVTAGFNASYEKGILGNRIYANGGLGIDLQRDGVTENDPDDSDGDGLANRLQNFPVLEAAHVDSAIAITGALTSRAETGFRIEFFANDTCDPSGHGQGQRYLGGEYVTSDEGGVAAFIVVFTDPIEPAASGDFIAATATDPDGNTSEFSACLQATGATETQPLIFLPTLRR